MKTYRDILNWGDGRETIIDAGTKKLVKEVFGIDIDAKTHQLPKGDKPVANLKPSALNELQIKALEAICGAENVSTSDFERARHGFGKFYGELLQLRYEKVPTPPDAVVFPRNEQEVSEIVKFCIENRLALTPFGGNSSVTRGLETPKGGITLNLTKHFNKVLNVDVINQSVKVQAGMFGPAFEAHLNQLGYSCGHFPQSFEFSTVGGWVAAKGAGQASTGYGKIEHMVLGLKAVCTNGIVEMKELPAMAEAWDLKQLFYGSEGALGVITEVTMRIQPYKPENTQYASFIFNNFESAVNTMRTALQSGCGAPHLFRISDAEETEVAFSTKGFNGTIADKFLQFMGYKPEKRVLMLMTVEGHKKYAKLVKQNVKSIAKSNGGMFIGGGPTKKWLEHRYSSAYLREPMMDAGLMTDTIETAVTWTNLLGLYHAIRSYVKQRPKTVCMIHISHAYQNGANLYITFLSPADLNDPFADYANFHKGLVETIIANKGSLSHHHGIGRALAPYMPKSLGNESFELLKGIKKTFDPNGIFNPGVLGL